MDLTRILWDDALSLRAADPLVIALLAASLCSLYIVSSVQLKKKDGGRTTKTVYPPYAPGGMWKHIQMCTSPEYPWWILDVARQLGTRVFQVSLPTGPNTRNFIVGEPATVRAILTDSLSSKPLDVYGHMRNVNGGWATMFTTNGAAWHKKRKACAPAFSSNQVKRMTRVALEKTEAWIEDTLLAKNASFDVSNEMIGIVLSAIVETAFEYDMCAEEKQYFGSELELALVEFAVKSPSNPLRCLFGFFIPERRRAFLAAKRLKALVLKMMNDWRKREKRTNGTIMQLVMESDDAFETDDDKAGQLLEFLIAGHDTTAYSISWILLNLARNPVEQAKLKDALVRMSPEKWSSSEQLQNVVKEAMRLHPVASAGSIRTIGRDIITGNNELLPRGSVCFLPFMLLFRNLDVFGEPDSFRPSRWESPSREMLDAFSPFSLGSQNCIGQSLAKAETFAIAARICSEFELSVESEGRVEFFLTLKPVGARLVARRYERK